MNASAPTNSSPWNWTPNLPERRTAKRSKPDTMAFNQDKHPEPFLIKLIEGEHAPEPRPMSLIE